jgi:hypothetical protein
MTEFVTENKFTRRTINGFEIKYNPIFDRDIAIFSFTDIEGRKSIKQVFSGCDIKLFSIAQINEIFKIMAKNLFVIVLDDIILK